MRLVKPMMRIDGREIDIRHVGRSPELWGLVSDEGPLLVWRASGSDAAPSATQQIAPAPPPKPGDARAVHVTLERDRAPLRAEQLPATTSALRRSTLSRRIVTALNMRHEDVPEAAYVSSGAAACGDRDLFFELMNDVPVDLAELQRNQAVMRTALACGKSLLPRLRAGAAVFEVEYLFDDVPTSFALLTVANDSLRDKLLYAPLSPTPSGVHRAYCMNETGSARSVCQDGARSRLLFAVNQGYIAVYAAEAPTLLERLARSSPPPPDLAELAALFREPSPAEEVAIAKGGNCGFAVDFTFVDLSPDETNRQRVIDAINDNALFCGTHSSGSVLDASRRLVFVGKDEAATASIEAALKRRALEVRFESGAPDQNRGERRLFNEAMRSAAARAAGAAKVERVGRRLSLTMTLEPNVAEKRDMAPFLDGRAAKAKLAARIVEGLAEGKLPTPRELETLGERTTK